MAVLFRTDDIGARQGVPLMRIGFAWNLFEKRKQEDSQGEPKFGCQLIAPKAANWEILIKAVRDAAVGAWGEKAIARLKDGFIKNPIIDANTKQGKDASTGEFKPGMSADVYFIRPNTTRKPSVWNAKRDPILDKDLCPSGWWGYPVLHAFAWNHPSSGDGVSFGITMFQVVKEDEILGGGGGGDPEKFFEKIDTGEATGAEKPASAADMFG